MLQMLSVTYEVDVDDMATACSLLEDVPGFSAGYELRSAINGHGLIVAEKVYEDPNGAAFDEDLDCAQQILNDARVRFRQRAVEVTIQRATT